MEKLMDVHNAIASFNPLRETRVIDEIGVGQWCRQGDLYVERVGEAGGGTLTANRQLAPGTTQGSRHTVDASVKVYSATDARVRDNRLLGPVVESDTRFTISHPEHAEFSLPAGIYQISYQVDWKTQERVKD